MASRKLVRDFFIARKPLYICLTSQQGSNVRLRLLSGNGYSSNRKFSVFNEFSKKIKGEANINPEFHQSVEELKGKAEELKARTKQTTEQLYKQVDGVWTEAEVKAKKVSANMKEKISAAKEEVKEIFGIGKEESSQSTGTSGQHGADVKDGGFFGFPKVKGSKAERSTRTDIVVLPSKQSSWSKKWDAFKEKIQGHPLFNRVSGLGEPVVTKGQEIAEDMRERWETSDNPIVHKIQDMNESIFQETDAATSYKEIRRQDPSFSLPEFVAEVQEAVRPVLNAYIKGDVETLKKYCSPEVIDRCKAEHTAYQSHGIFFDNKILHISDVEVRETKMMGTSPIIIVAFQTQQIHCVRDREGKITEGGKDTIHTVYYAWAMQQVDVEELGEGALYPIWKLREMQQIGVQALV
ncbi:hypothetical protein V6N13_146928 [Hibiscus sabdariffa]|uniref:Tim44-like domain-containing protein n=1 Tax=Hibiscus sabdariffa TaxID=183260 RepID=A0ABR2TUV8_9ROSI